MKKKFLVFLVVVLCMNFMVNGTNNLDRCTAESIVLEVISDGTGTCDCNGNECGIGNFCSAKDGCENVCEADVKVVNNCYCGQTSCEDGDFCLLHGIDNHMECLKKDRECTEDEIVKGISCSCEKDQCDVGNICSVSEGCKCAIEKFVENSCSCGGDQCSMGKFCARKIMGSDEGKCECIPEKIVEGSACFCGENRCDTSEFCTKKTKQPECVPGTEVGCTDREALNYIFNGPKLTVDDGSCKYNHEDECGAYEFEGECTQKGDYLGCLWDGVNKECLPCKDDDVAFMTKFETDITCQRYVAGSVLNAIMNGALETPEKIPSLIHKFCNEEVYPICPRTCGMCHYKYCDSIEDCAGNEYCDDHDQFGISKHQNRLHSEKKNACWPLDSYCIYDDPIDEMPPLKADCSQCNDGIWIGGEIFASCNELVTTWGHLGLTCNIIDILTGNTEKKACAGCDLCINADDVCLEINFEATCKLLYNCKWKKNDGYGVEGCVCGDSKGVVETCQSHSACFYNNDADNDRFPGLGCFNTLSEHIEKTGQNVDHSIHEVKKANAAAVELNQVAEVLYNGLSRNKDNINHLQEKIGKNCGDYDNSKMCAKHNDEHCLWDDSADQCVKDKCSRFSEPMCHVRSYCYWAVKGCHDSFKDQCMDLSGEQCNLEVGDAATHTPACTYNENTFLHCQFDCRADFLDDESCERFFGCTWKENECSADTCSNYKSGYEYCNNAPKEVLGGCGFNQNVESCTRCGSVDDAVECNELYGCIWKNPGECTVGLTQCGKDFHTVQTCEDTKSYYPPGKQCHWSHRNQCEEYIPFNRALDETVTKSRERRERE